MQKEKKFHYRIGSLILIVLQMVLAFVALAVYAADQKVNFVPFAVAMPFVLALPFVFLKHWNMESFFRWSVLYYAFIPTSDLVMLCELPQKENLFRIDFILGDSLMILSALPREFFGLLILLGFATVWKGYPWKKQYTLTIAGAAFLGVFMLVLPGVSEILAYVILYMLIILAYVWAEKMFVVPMEKYEKVLLWILMLLIWARGCYRMLAILEVYPPIW